MKFKTTLIAVASSTLLVTGLAHAANPTAPAAPAAKSADKNMAHPGPRSDAHEALEKKLRAGKNRADYERILKSDGYRIAAINEDKKDYLEYEVVKGADSYEVQIDFKDGAAKASEIAVQPNMWRAEATERMLEDPKYQNTAPLVADTQGRYSDRRLMKRWTDEKDQLEKALPDNLKASEYRSKLEGMGYKVTAVNDKEKDHVEYEIVKGDNSYEVQIDLDPATGMGRDVEVASNWWEADATDRATDRADDKKN